MTLFAQQQDETVRRVRSNHAWKKRNEERRAARHERRRLIAKIDETLAFKQVDSILARKQRLQANQPKPVVVEKISQVAPTSAATQTSVTTRRPAKPAKAAPRFKAVISASGKIVAMPLN